MRLKYAIRQSRSLPFYELGIDWIVEKKTFDLLFNLSVYKFVCIVFTVVFDNKLLGESLSCLLLLVLRVNYLRKIVVFSSC